MTQSKPRIGFKNLLYDNRLHLRASTELSTDYPVENLAEWTAGRYWRPTHVSTPPAIEYVYCYPLNKVDATSGGARLDVLNWYMRDWTAGAAAAPDNWTLAGASATVARDASPVKIDQYSAEITRAGADCYLSQSITSGWSAGQQVTAGAWVYATVADRARVTIITDAGSTSSSYHAGSSAWVWLEATHEIEYNATTLAIRLEVKTGDTAANFDGVAMYLGSGIDSTPHASAVTYAAAHDHNYKSSGMTVTVESSDDPGSWASPTTRLTFAPDDDTSTWIDGASVSKSAWRFKFAPAAAGSPPVYVAVLALGAYVELPEWLDIGWDPYRKELRSELVKAKGGAPIQRGIKREPARLSWSIQAIAETSVYGDLKDLWDHAGSGSPGGLPFFFQWDDGDHATQTLFCSLPEGSSFSAPLREGYRVTRFQVDMEVVQE